MPARPLESVSPDPTSAAFGARVGLAGIGLPTPLVVLVSLLAVTLILVASLLRLWDLDRLVVWHDEVFTLVRVFGFPQPEVEGAIFSHRLFDPAFLLHFQGPDPRYGWWDSLRAFMEHPEHAPLYYVLAKLATLLPIDAVTAARGTSAIFGVLLAPAVYWLMRELFGRGPIPWVAALLAACSPTHFLYAQEARQYALWTLTAVAATAALVRALRRGHSPDWWLYGSLCAVGLWSHVLFALLLPIHAAYGLLACRGRPLAGPARRWTLAAGGALAVFSPWLLVLAIHHERATYYTAWLARPMSGVRMAIEWAIHLPRLFLDFNQPGLGLRTLLLIPLAWAVIRFLRRAPRPAAWLLLAIAAVYTSAILVPDLLFGGSRSQHVRYALPSMLAIQLMVAWTIGDALASPSLATRRLAAGTLAVLVVFGALSLAAIERSDTWWNKKYSAENWALARQLNAGHRPLVLASGSGVAIGELISLAYRLDDRVRLWGERWGNPEPPPGAGFDEPVVLTPSLELLTFLGRDHRLVPFDGTWQWFQAEPLQGAQAAAPEASTDPVPDADRTDPPQPLQGRPAGDTP